MTYTTFKAGVTTEKEGCHKMRAMKFQLKNKTHEREIEEIEAKR